MTGYLPPLDDITTAVLTLLRGTGRTVYDGAYGGDPISPTYPYGILYRIAGGSADPMPDLDLDLRTVTIPFQVTTVSDLRNQCERAARGFADRLFARTLDHADQLYGNAAGWAHDLVMPTGWVCVERRPDPAMPGVDRSGEVPSAVFSAPARFYLTVVPA